MMNSEKCVLLFIGLVIALGFLGPLARGNENYIPIREYEFQEESKDEVFMNKKFRSGLHLIYDCKDRYFACVDKESYKSCQDVREKALTYSLEKILPCAPFKKFPTRVECLKAQYAQIQRPGNLAVCQRFEVKKR